MDKEIVLDAPVAIEQPVERKPWDRQADESSFWYDCFLVYRNLPPHDRSIIAAYREHRRITGYGNWRQIVNASSDWYAQGKALDWSRRATLYDDYIIKQAEAEAEQAVRQWYARSRLDLIHVWDDLRAEYDEAEDGNMSKSQVTQAMKTIASLTTPTAPTQSIDVQIILDKLPPDVQTALLNSLKR